MRARFSASCNCEPVTDKVLETTFQIDSAELAELLLDKTETLVEERNTLRRELEAERKRIFLVKQKLLKTATELENEQKHTAKLTKALEDSEKYREAAETRRREQADHSDNV